MDPRSILIVVASLVLCGASPLPDDYSDTDTIDDPLLNDVLPKYDLQSLKNDFNNDPVVSSISSDVKNSLQIRDDVTTPPSLQGWSGVADQNVLDALTELVILSRLLKTNLQYIDTRKQDDPKWTFSIASKVGSNGGSDQFGETFQQDLHQAVTGIVIMRMMEDRVTMINKYVQDYLSSTSQDVSFSTLFGGNDGVQVMEGLFALKYLEGFLHATNILIEDTVNNPTSSGVLNDIVTDGIIPYSPPNERSDDENDIESGIGAFLILTFCAIGFFFVLYMVVYLAWKALQLCNETCFVSEGKKSKTKNKAKYEQI